MNANPTDRDAYIAGLHELADFLATHPDVPCPAIERIILHRLPNVVGFLDGLDEVPVVPGTARTGSHGDRHYVDVARTFAGLTFEAMTDADHVGDTVEVPSTTVEFHPLSPAHIRAALAQSSEGAENGTAGTAPSATVRPWRRGDRVRLVEQIGDGTGWTLGKVYDQWTDEGRLLDDDGDPRPVLTYRGSRFELVAEQAGSVACDPLPAHVEAVTAP